MEADGAALAVSIACVVVSSLTTTFGLFFQKIAQQRSLALESTCAGPKVIANRKSFRCWTCVYWLCGFLCITIFSFALDLYSMATLGQSLVVPLLACLEVAENQIFAPLVLGERFDRCRDTTASVVVIVGALCTTFFGPGGPFGGTTADPTPEMDYPEMKKYFAGLFLAPVFVVFEASTIALLIACLVLPRCGCCQKLHFLMLGYVAGCLGGQQNMFLKGVGTSFTTGFGGDASVFGDWMVYVFVFFMVALASLQLFFLNQGLARFQALLFVPTYTILYIVSGTLVGLVFYQEYKLMSNIGWIMFCVGFLFIAASMFILATKKQHPLVDEIQEIGTSDLGSHSGMSDDTVHSRASPPATPLPPSVPMPTMAAVFTLMHPAEPLPPPQTKMRRAVLKAVSANSFSKRTLVLPAAAAEPTAAGEARVLEAWAPLAKPQTVLSAIAAQRKEEDGQAGESSRAFADR